jgi:hypothetical protein
MSGAIDERPVFFGDSNHLFGIVATGDSSGEVHALIALTPGMDDSPVAADLARRLASEGIPSLRFDLPGQGESTASSGSGANPFLAAARFVRDGSDRPLLLIGGATGAAFALAAATELEGLTGVAFTRLPLKHRADTSSRSRAYGRAMRLVRRLTSAGGRGWESTVDRKPVAELAALVERAVPFLVIAGAEETDHARVRRALSASFPDLPRHVELVSVGARFLRDFPTLASRREFVDAVSSWVGLRLRDAGTSLP